MRTLITSILVLAAVAASANNFSNKTTDNLNTEMKYKLLCSNLDDEVQKPEKPKKSNIERYADLRRTANTFSLLTVASSGLAIASEEYNLFIVSGGMAIGAYICYLSADKWVRKHAIEISEKGLVVRF